MSLDDFCQSLDVDKEELVTSLKTIQYEYDEKTNQFI